jgi:DNA ligase-1
MLAEPAASAEEAAQAFEHKVYAEFKYDGVRAQLHKRGAEVRLYSRRLEEITESFPEVVKRARALDHDVILDGEIVPFAEGKPLPFQLLQRRLRRQEGFEEAASRAPVRFSSSRRTARNATPWPSLPGPRSWNSNLNPPTCVSLTMTW